MPLADSSRAIGAVTGLVRHRIQERSSRRVTVGRPAPASADGGLVDPRLNLFLYEAQLDPHLRDAPPGDRGGAPLWLALRYLLTAFDASGESDTIDALHVLGDGLRALVADPALALTGLPPEDHAVLAANPQTLRVTLTDAPAGLLASLMQGADDRYRFSMAFDVRPVMIAASV